MLWFAVGRVIFEGICKDAAAKRCQLIPRFLPIPCLEVGYFPLKFSLFVFKLTLLTLRRERALLSCENSRLKLNNLSLNLSLIAYL